MENMGTTQPLENIKIGEICRACFENCEKYKMLYEKAENAEKLSLGDVFFNVVKIESKSDTESTPGRICIPCSKDLLNAYDFIQKSQKNNQRLLDYLKNVSLKQPDCLSESPIDIPCESNAADFLQIKVEDETIKEYSYPEDKASVASSSDADSDDDQPLMHKQTKINKMQCPYCNRIFKRTDFLENHKRKHEEELKNKGPGEDCSKIACEDCGFSCNSKLELKAHRTTIHTARIESSERENSNSCAKQINSFDKSAEANFRLRGNETVVNPHLQNFSKVNPEILMLQCQINNLKETCLKEFKEIKELLLKQNTVKNASDSKETVQIVQEKPERRNEQHIPIWESDKLFPINTEDQLYTLNSIGDDQKLVAISTVRQLIWNGGLCANMNKIFGNRIVVNYNYEGKRGKKSLKNLNNVNEIIFRAAFNNGYTMADYENDLRRGFKIMKNRYFKNECLKRKKEFDLSSGSNNLLMGMNDYKKLKQKLKTRSQRSRVNTRSQVRETKTESGRFECDSCNKTFAWKKDLFRHEKYHDPNNRKYPCPHCERRFVRKDKLTSHLLVHLAGIPKRSLKSSQIFANHLFSEKKFKEIKCMICNFDKAATVSELRRHIVLHNNLELIKDLENCEVVKTFYPGKNLQEVIPMMASQIADKQFGKFYSVVNSNSYEMGISDSDQSDPDLEHAYACELCNEEFNRKHKLMTHQAYEHTLDECPYKCDSCHLKFTSQHVLQGHLKYQCKNPEKSLQCEKCPGRFAWQKNFENHRCGDKKSAVVKESTKCEICEKVFIYPRDLRTHKKTHIPDGKAHNCSVCGEKFLRLENLRRHLQAHSKKAIAVLRPKKILCMLCSSEFESIPKLKQHLYSHSDGLTEVNFETSGFVSYFYPEVDKDTVSEFIRNCFNEQKLGQLYMAVNKYGLEMVLSDSDTDDENKPEESSYVCERCDVKFPRIQEILQHQLVEHSTHKKSSPHKCENCEDHFVCAALLNRHIKNECLNSDKIHKCKRCGVKFMWKQNLVAHACPRGENYENDKTCEICGKKFIWLKDLHRHKRSHIPEEMKLQCQVCDRKFNRKDNMRAHMKVHTNDYKQQKLRALVKWEQPDENMCRPHGIKDIQCKICLSKHNSIRDLTTHLLGHMDMETLKHREAEIDDIAMLLYNRHMDLQTLSDEISNDLSNGKNARFYSIINEAGYELSLNDSETCSDLEAQAYDDDDDDEDSISKGYSCKLCNKKFNRKFKIFYHQMNDHVWDELPFECVSCGSKFVCERLYSHHQKSECENPEKQYKCKQCPIRFVWKENLKNHEKHAHEKNAPQAKKYPCTICDKSFLWHRDLQRHSKIHKIKETKFECTWCFRIFMRKDNLKVHMKVHQNATHLLLPDIYYLARPNGSKTAECKLCSEKYSTIHELFDHAQNVHFYQMRVTIPNPTTYSITNALGYEMDIDDSETEKEDTEEKYLCEICDARFNRRFKLLQHQQSLHYSDNIPHKCEICHFKCVSKVVLSYHMRAQCLNSLKQFRCSRCTMRFMWKENLENHESLIHDSARTHNCNVCKRDFATLHDLRNHSDCKPPVDVKYFECDLCSRKYNRKDRLLKHVRIFHNGTGAPRVKSAPSTDKKFLCAFCGKEVSSSSNLVIHMRRHTGEKPFKCEFCNKGFPRSSDLSCHRRTHTGERPHKCTVCDKAFSRSYKLQTHMRIHSGERPYKCTYCEKSFTQSNDLTLHVRRHTGERPYICETCGERFIQGTALRNHRRMRGHYEL